MFQQSPDSTPLPSSALPDWGSAVPFYPGYFPIEPWDSLSGFVHLGTAWLAFQASDWMGTLWTSLSDLLINNLC